MIILKKVLVLLAYASVAACSHAEINQNHSAEIRCSSADNIWTGSVISATEKTLITGGSPSSQRGTEFRVQIAKSYKGVDGGIQKVWIPSTSTQAIAKGMINKSFLFFVERTSGGEFTLDHDAGGVARFSAPARGSIIGGCAGLQADARYNLDAAGTEEQWDRSLTVLSKFQGINEQTEAALNRFREEHTSYDSRVLTILSRATPSTSAYASLLIKEVAEGANNKEEPPPIDTHDVIRFDANPSDLHNLELITSTSKLPPLRSAAMSAIRKMQLPGSTGFLVKMLDSTDPMIQYDAVITLAELTKQRGNYAPSIGLFKQNPSQYIQIWKDWAKQSGVHD